MWPFKRKDISFGRFYIEHYPITGKYVAKYGNRFLRINPYNGIIECVNDLNNVYSWSMFGNQKDAQNIIDQYKEQQNGGIIIKEKIENK